RPMSQGANPWSDLGCREALRLLGQFLERAVNDASDDEAREQMMWAATLAGIAFGNAGVHAPHGMAYAVAGLVRDFRPSGYPADDVVALTDGAHPQQRLLQNAPREMSKPVLADLFRQAMRYW